MENVRINNREKGSVTIFVLIICLFFIAVLLLVNIGIINKTANQEKEIAQITKNYTVTNDDLEHAYSLATNENTFVTLKDVEQLIEQSKLKIYPIGSIYMSTDSTNPSELFGGTWEEYAKGRTLVGIDSTQTEFDTIDEQGGEKTHTLSVQEMPSHTHIQNSHTHTQDPHSHSLSINTTSLIGHFYCVSYYTHSASGIVTKDYMNANTSIPDKGTTFGGGGYNIDASHSHTGTAVSVTATNQSTTATNQNTGGSQAHNNLQPYIVTYMWKRIA